MEYSLEIAFDLKISEEDIEHIVVTAIEGGTGYWACLDNSRPEWEEAYKAEDITSLIATRLLLEGKTLYFTDVEDDEVKELTLSKLLEGIKKEVSTDGTEIVNLDTNHLENCLIDSDVADRIFQYAMFGELIFG